MPQVKLSCCLAVVAWLTSLTAAAQPLGGFAAVLDKQANFGDSRRSVVFYDTDDLSAPLFGVFLGNEASNGNNTFEDPDSFTVDPATGDVYVLAFDSGDPTANTIEFETTGQADREGDLDLYRIDFQAAYNDWTANHQASGRYVTYGEGSGFDPSHANAQTGPVVVQKIGEIGRSEGVGEEFSTHLEFIDQNTLAYVDAPDLRGPDGGLVDVQIRRIDRVSASPGAATSRGNPNGTEGGFNNGTTESWESTLVGRVNLDPDVDQGDGLTTPNPSEIVSIAAARGHNGVTGLWILERDFSTDIEPGDGEADDLAFFAFGDSNGGPVNAYRPINLSDRLETSTLPQELPGADEFSNGTKVFVHPGTGDLVLVDSGFFDDHQPRAQRVQVLDYDNANNAIEAVSVLGSQVEIAVSNANDDGFPAGEPPLIDGRHVVYDWVNEALYFLDKDGEFDTENGGTSFAHDWYRLDLTTGVTTLVGADADESNGLFDISSRADDHVEFFFLELPGDETGDGLVDIRDYTAIRDQIGGGTTLADIEEWRENFQGFVAPDPLPVAVPAPEPASLLLFALGGAFISAARRR